GNEVHVLDDDHGRLQGPGNRARRRDHVERSAGEQHDGHARQPAEKVPDRVGLASPWRAVQQDAAPQMLAARDQAGSMPCNTETLTLDPCEQVWGQDDLLPLDTRALDEAEQCATVMAKNLVTEGDHVSPENVVHQAQPPDLVDHLACAARARACYFEVDVLDG